MRIILTTLLATTMLAGCNNETLKTASQTTAKAGEPAIQAERTFPSSVVKKLYQAAMNDTQGYDIIESLTTEIGPRLAGSPEEAEARNWAVAKFKELGFENVRVEPFTIPGWKRGAPWV